NVNRHKELETIRVSVHHVEERAKRGQSRRQTVEAHTKLAAHEVEEREAARRTNHPGRHRQSRKLGGLVERLLEAAERIDHFEIFRLHSGEDAAVRKLDDVRTIELAAGRDRVDELRVNVVQER